MLLWTRARLKSAFYLPDLSLLRFSVAFQHTGTLLLRASRVVLCRKRFWAQKISTPWKWDWKLWHRKCHPLLSAKRRSRLITLRRAGEIRLLSQSVVGEAVRLLGFLFFLSQLNKQKRDQSVLSTAMLTLPVEQQCAGRRIHGIAVFIWLSVMLV